jgi:SAM-dependent methyltransferase
MRSYDATKTEDFFNTAFTQSQKAHIDANPDERLHPRDQILLERVLPKPAAMGGLLIDYACGQGRLLAELLNRGYDCVGMEKHPGMHDVAVAELTRHGLSANQVKLGALDLLVETESESAAGFLAIGLFQYLSEAELETVFAEAHRVLKPGGLLVATLQNAFFDMFTFNKYTVDFIVNDLLSETLDAESRDQVQPLIEGLMPNSDMPPYAPDRARDNIFVRLSNPLLANEIFNAHGFTTTGRYFYEYFGLPPLVQNQNREIVDKVRKHYEVDRAESWQGMFLANAFLVSARKA